MILGPTGAGKTDLAIAVAERYGAHVVSMDAMQVYRGMDIGTAKPTRAELAEIPHHLVDIRDPDQPFTATEFRLLEFLMTRPGIVFSREQLLDAVWGHDRAVTDRTVDVYILRLRQKIETKEGRAYIRSVRGFGYSFRAETPVAA